MFFIFCHHWTVWPAFDSVDCGGHHAISCQTCWIENANGKGPTYDPALYRDFYVSWKLIITHLRLGTHKFVRVFWFSCLERLRSVAVPWRLSLEQNWTGLRVCWPFSSSPPDNPHVYPSNMSSVFFGGNHTFTYMLYLVKYVLLFFGKDIGYFLGRGDAVNMIACMKMSCFTFPEQKKRAYLCMFLIPEISPPYLLTMFQLFFDTS